MIHWNVSPTIGQFGAFEPRWYGLLFGLGVAAALNLFGRLNRIKGEVPDEERLFWYVLAGTILGARVGHCVFYDPGYYFSNPLEIVMIWRGGLASHGAVLGIFLAVYLFHKKFPRIGMLAIFDLLAAPTALAGFFIRLGNLMNSEIIGRPTALPWAFVFERVDGEPRHPTQIYEALLYGVFALLLVRLFRRKAPSETGIVFGAWLVLVFTARFFIEFLKEDQSAFERGLPIDMGQILSVPLIVLGIAVIVRAKKNAAQFAVPSAKS